MSSENLKAVEQRLTQRKNAYTDILQVKATATGELATIEVTGEAHDQGYAGRCSRMWLEHHPVAGAFSMKTRRISYWSGKVNQRNMDGKWLTDPDGRSGANVDMLSYCKKWWKDTTSVEKLPNRETISFSDAGNKNSYKSTRDVYACRYPSSTKAWATIKSPVVPRSASYQSFTWKLDVDANRAPVRAGDVLKLRGFGCWGAGIYTRNTRATFTIKKSVCSPPTTTTTAPSSSPEVPVTGKCFTSVAGAGVSTICKLCDAVNGNDQQDGYAVNGAEGSAAKEFAYTLVRTTKDSSTHKYTLDSATQAYYHNCPAPLPDTTNSKCCKARTLKCRAGCARLSEAAYCVKNPASRVCPTKKAAACCTSLTAECVACAAKAASDALGKLADIFRHPGDVQKRPTKDELDAGVQAVDADKIKQLLTEFPFAKIPKGNAKTILDKLKDDNGAFGNWGADQLRESDKILSGFNAEDIDQLDDGALFGSVDKEGKKTNGALATFGKILDWGRRQAEALATKFIESLAGGLKSAKAEDLKSAGSILEGLKGEDIDEIKDDAWEKGAKGAFKEVCKKKGALDASKRAAIKKHVQKQIPKPEEATPAQITDEGGLLGTLGAEFLAKLPVGVVKNIAASAIATMGAKTCSEAFDAPKIAELSEAARALINGDGVKEFNLAQIKALVGVKEGETLGAFIDITHDHSDVATGGELLARVTSILEERPDFRVSKVTLLQDALAVATSGEQRAEIATGRRRRLTGEADMASKGRQSCVRVETDTVAYAELAASAAAQEGSITLVPVDDIVSVPGIGGDGGNGGEVVPDGKYLVGGGDVDHTPEAGAPIVVIVGAAVGGIALIAVIAVVAMVAKRRSEQSQSRNMLPLDPEGALTGLPVAIQIDDSPFAAPSNTWVPAKEVGMVPIAKTVTSDERRAAMAANNQVSLRQECSGDQEV